jgi:exodeoxyribonuclease VII large subunit
MPRGQRDLQSFLGTPEPGPDRPSAQEDGTAGGQSVMSVTELTDVIKGLLEAEPSLQDARVTGEVSGVRPSSKGHLYFTLKDEGSQVPCVMFGRAGARVQQELKDGDRVIVHGRVEVYPPYGKYQLIVDAVERRGVGDLYQRYLELKSKLEREGLFAPERKRPLPALPRRIGVVTSATGAVFHDIVRIIRRRWPHVRVTLSHASVQGDAAPPELVAALDRLCRLGDVEVIIVARGGGSFEDLFAFNDEALARAIHSSPVPVVSAVGHETDFTIADFVADVRAPTPSAAAELVVPVGAEEEARIATHLGRMRVALVRALELGKQRLDDLDRRLSTELRHQLDRRSDALRSFQERLEALGPMSTLRRGYAIALDAGGGLVSSVGNVAEGDALEVVLADGRVDAGVRRVRPDPRADPGAGGGAGTGGA